MTVNMVMLLFGIIETIIGAVSIVFDFSLSDYESTNIDYRYYTTCH